MPSLNAIPGKKYLCTVELRGGGIARRVVAAGSADEARRLAVAAGDCFLLEVRDLASARGKGLFGSGVSDEELVLFLRQWQILLRAGIPVAQAIRGALEQKAGSGLERVLLAAVSDIEGGRTVSDAVSAFPDLFPPHFVASLSVAEKTGNIPEAIGRQIDHITRLRELRRTLVAASVYPAVLLASMVVVVIFLLAYVLPSFARIYADSKVELPAMTVAFISLSDAIRGHWPWLAAGAAAAVLSLRVAWRSPLRTPIEKLLFRAPMLGDILMDQAMARFCRTFSTLLKGGFPLLDSLRLSIDGVSGLFLRERLGQVAFAVEGGESLGSAIRRSGAFSGVAVQLLEAGEKGGTLTPMLDEIAEYSEEDLRHRVKVATTLLEPAMMILVGLLVAGLVVAIYLPIFRIAGVSG